MCREGVVFLAEGSRACGLGRQLSLMFIMHISTASFLRLVLGLLQVLVRKERYGGTDENDCVDGDAAVAAGLDGLSCVGDLLCGRFWCWVTLLRGQSVTSSLNALRPTRTVYLSLEVADQQTVEDLPGLIAVANVLERLGGILAAHVEQDLFTTSVVKLTVSRRITCRGSAEMLRMKRRMADQTYGCSSTKLEEL